MWFFWKSLAGRKETRISRVLQAFGDALQVGDKRLLDIGPDRIRAAENRGRMERRKRARRPFGRKDLPMLAAYTKLRPKQSLRGDGPQADDDFRTDRVEFGLKPWNTRPDFAGVCPRRKSLGPALHPLEMLNGQGDVGLSPINADLAEHGVEQLSRRPGDRTAHLIVVALRLVGHKDEPGVARPLAENRLSCAAMKLAAAARPSRLS